MKKFLFYLLLSLAFQFSYAENVSEDNNYRQEVMKAFDKRINDVGESFFDIKGLNATQKETAALKFLYAYMPTADLTDYTTDFYLQNVRATFKAREEMPWGKQVPGLLFRHFVLPLRVNNENLDDSRIQFFNELKQRVQGMTMKDAILEVNHWCHERVTYAPSDARTLSPLACVKNALGRCGEESTFTVAALRAIGIPARQVYTPRWAHTDDNHAWVEAWADGKWYFMGACEPEPVLNLGWFNAPASRALLMHTRVFGDYRGPEEVVLKTSNFTEINLIDNYAKTEKMDFTVVDRDNRPVENARVDFKIYNYAEFYTAVTKYTDQKGHVSLTAGKGDMIVWASKNGEFGFIRASFNKDKTATIKLSHNKQLDQSLLAHPLDSFDITPPEENVVLPFVSQEMAEANQIRFEKENTMRKAYEATFYHQQDSSETGRILELARGNWRTIRQFIDKHSDDQQRAIALLKFLSTKDLRDMPMEILDDNYYAASDQLCPRVENEMIIKPFKRFFEKAFDKQTADKFRNDPAELVSWVRKNIRINPDKKALRIAQTPIGVWNSRLTDTRSRDIFFVDVARSLDIEARKDVVTSKLQYKKDGHWYDVNFDAIEQNKAPQGTLVLDYSPSKYIDNPEYYSHFSISKIENGRARLLNFDEGEVDMGGGTSWKNTFKNGTRLDEGTYLLVTGTRMASGKVLSANQLFNIRAGKTTKLDLHLRTSKTDISVIGNFGSESQFTHEGKNVSILSQTGRGYYVLGIISNTQEPSIHALNDIAKCKKELEKWNRPFVILFESEKEMREFSQKKRDMLPKNTIFGLDKDGSILKQAAAKMKLQNTRLLPVFMIADTFDRVVFFSQGYTIGLGKQIQQVADKL